MWIGRFFLAGWLAVAIGSTCVAQTSADEFIKRGEEKSEKLDYKGAIADYSRAIELDPQHYGAYSLRMLAREKINDKEGAASDYKRLREIELRITGYPDPMKELLETAKRNTKLQEATLSRAQEKAKSGDTDGAIAEYTSLIEFNRLNGSAYVSRGRLKASKGDFAGAIADYTEALKFHPKDANAYSNRAIAKSAKGDVEGAIADFTSAIEIDPEDASARCNRGIAKYKNGDFEGAIADHTSAIKINPNYVDAYFERGNAKGEHGDIDGAITDYTRAIELLPTHTPAFINRGLYKAQKGDMEGAIADYTSAIHNDPKDTRTYTRRGISLAKQGDLEGAIADFSSVLAIKPKDAKTYSRRALAKSQQGDLEGAIADYTSVLEINPIDSKTYFNRGRCSYLLQLYKDALSDNQRCCKMDAMGTQTDAHFSVWLIRARLGEREAADKDLRAYLAKRWKAAPGDWVSLVAGYLVGDVSEADLFKAADVEDQELARGRYCEAWFYAGMLKLIAGDKAAATTYFRKSIATGEKDSTAFLFAQAELKALAE